MIIKGSGSYIKEKRIDKVMSQEEFCQDVCSSVYLSRVENGYYHISEKKFLELCQKNDVCYTICSYDINEIIRNTRYSLKISQRELSIGLCSRANLSKIENSTIIASSLLLEALLERLGYYDSESIYISSEHEVILSQYKKEVLDSFFGKKKICNVQIGFMDSYERKLYRQLNVINSLNYSIDDIPRILKMLLLTQPTFMVSSFSSLLFNTTEIVLVIALAKIYIKEHEYRRAEIILQEIELFFKKNTFAKEYSEVYPYFNEMYLKFLRKKEEY